MKPRKRDRELNSHNPLRPVPKDVLGRVLMDIALVNPAEKHGIQLYLTESKTCLNVWQNDWHTDNHDETVSNVDHVTTYDAHLVDPNARETIRNNAVFMVKGLLDGFCRCGYVLLYCGKQDAELPAWAKDAIKEIWEASQNLPILLHDTWISEVEFPGQDRWIDEELSRPRLSKEQWLKANYPELSELPKWRFPAMAG
jgi:hypothetical protein